MAILSTAAIASVASAQVGGKREGYVFLEAVRDRDGTVVTDMVEQPGGDSLINTRDLTSGDTALHVVAERRDPAWIKFLGANGANPNLANKQGVTPLMISTRLGHVEGVTALLEIGARVDPLSSTGETPLISAVHRRDVALVRILLANGANPDRTDNSGRSARDYVALLNERRMSEAFTEADDARDGTASEDYGPSL
ncbi:ankyrin repeat domain-containing protein [Alteriqipengyuania lutimaris]|uniref:Ankyrin repeat domain-containing protein n=2 Tax=Alteriqipengyuania lutimaris TaxID=1538146 RepID=A0A395LK99_9SPHN|nr:ankyrin repeat domain-containing protein [Alteriqipengyuania lutimaris]